MEPINHYEDITIDDQFLKVMETALTDLTTDHSNMVYQTPLTNNSIKCQSNQKPIAKKVIANIHEEPTTMKKNLKKGRSKEKEVPSLFLKLTKHKLLATAMEEKTPILIPIEKDNDNNNIIDPRIKTDIFNQFNMEAFNIILDNEKRTNDEFIFHWIKRNEAFNLYLKHCFEAKKLYHQILDLTTKKEKMLKDIITTPSL